MIIVYSNFIEMSNLVMKDVIKMLIDLSLSDIVEIFDVCKVGLFHIVNRFNASKKMTK